MNTDLLLFTTALGVALVGLGLIGRGLQRANGTANAATGAVLLLVGGILSAYIGFIGPYRAADSFVTTLSTFEFADIQEAACDASRIDQAAGLVGLGISTTLLNQVANTDVSERFFNPLTRQMSFTLRVQSGLARVDQTLTGRVSVRAQGRWGYCVYAIEGLTG